jgi:hypothetical protein
MHSWSWGRGYTPTWVKEDPQTIAAAIGSYIQGRPNRKFSTMLVLLRAGARGHLA